MGYACPVCSDPQADANHLANHVAFSALLGDEAHEAWLDEHAPGWGEMGESDLADELADDIEETSFPQVFEDTAGGLADSEDSPEERSGALFDEGHDHSDHDRRAAGAPMDDEAEAILEEAREMTRRMLEDDAKDNNE